MMVSSELLQVLKQVLRSWQVIAMAVAIIFYWLIVGAAANMKPRPKSVAQKKKKLKRLPSAPEGIEKDVDASDLNIGD
jgi:hypothetical protein